MAETRFPTIEVSPNPSRFDENIAIVITAADKFSHRQTRRNPRSSSQAAGLVSNGSYTLHSFTHTRKLDDRFQCIAQYNADNEGIIDVAKQASRGGFYTGIKPMALIAELKSSSKSKRQAKPVRNDSMKPLEIFVHVYDGFIPSAFANGIMEPLNGLEILCETTIRRQAVIFAPGQVKSRSQRNNVKSIEFSNAPSISRSISDVTNSSTDSKLKTPKPRMFSTEF